MFRLILILTVVVCISCNLKNNKQSIKRKDFTQNNSKFIDYYTYDLDTGLVIFLWNDTLEDYDVSIEEYTSLATEKEILLKLMKDMLEDNIWYKEKLLNINRREKEFDKYIKEILIEEGQRYGNLSDSKELWYIEQTDIRYYDSLLRIYPIKKQTLRILE